MDIFVSHNSPKGIHDRDDYVHVGFEGLNIYIERTSPQFLIHGHQHVNTQSRLAETEVVGVFGHNVLKI